MAQVPIDFAIPPFGTPDSRRLGTTLTFMAMDAADLTAAVVMEKWFDLKSVVFDAQYVDIMITGKLLSIYVAILYTTAHHNVTSHYHTTSSHHIITPHHHTTSSHHIITPHHHTTSSHHIITPPHHTTSSHHLITPKSFYFNNRGIEETYSRCA
jgi:hypothetical protein